MKERAEFRKIYDRIIFLSEENFINFNKIKYNLAGQDLSKHLYDAFFFFEQAGVLESSFQECHTEKIYYIFDYKFYEKKDEPILKAEPLTKYRIIEYYFSKIVNGIVRTKVHYQGQYNIFFKDNGEYYAPVTDWSQDKSYIKKLLNSYEYNRENNKYSDESFGYLGQVEEYVPKLQSL